MNKISGILWLGFIIGMLVLFNYAYAELQENVQQIPTWIRYVFAAWAQELISDAELLNALQYLIQVGIIEL